MTTNKKEQPYTTNLKGVAALLGETPAESTANLIPVGSICLPPAQPRRYFDPEKLDQLVLSIKEHGILEPLLVRPLKQGDYELVAGERRYRAAQVAGLTEVPVVVRDLSDEEALQLALVENLHREDLNPVDETEGILQLLANRLKREVGDVTLLLYRMQNEVKGKVTQNVLGSEEGQQVRAMFDSLGLMTWESFTTSRLPLRNLPEDILDALRTGQIEYTKATAIARIKDLDQRQLLLEDAIQENLSLTQIRERIKAARPANEKPESLKNQIQEASSRLQKAKFWDNPKKQKQLEKLLAQMRALLADEQS